MRSKLFTTSDRLDDDDLLIIKSDCVSSAAREFGYSEDEIPHLGGDVVSGDCIARYPHAPSPEEIDRLCLLLAPDGCVGATDMHVSPPGAHPGGNWYWVNLRYDLYRVF